VKNKSRLSNARSTDRSWWWTVPIRSRGNRTFSFSSPNWPDQKNRLDELLALNHSLNTVYILKEELSRMWDYKYPGAARNFFEGWYRMAVESKIEPLLRFAKTLARHWEGIAAHCRHPIHTSVLEGVNNKAKVTKRVAFGFHDPEYFFLKLRAAFQGG